MEIDEIYSKIDKLRDEAIKICKELIKTSTYSIIETHKENFEKALEYLIKAREKKEELDKILKEEPRVKDYLKDFIDIAYQEYVEANQFFEILKNKNLKTREELGVDIYPYVSGILDAMGEIKRKIFDYLVKDKINEAKELITLFEELYNYLAPLSLYKFVPNLRSKIDMSRKSVEELKKYLIIIKKTN